MANQWKLSEEVKEQNFANLAAWENKPDPFTSGDRIGALGGSLIVGAGFSMLGELAAGAMTGAQATGPALEATELTGITANKVMGDAAADELANSLREAGLTVEREAPYSTPIGTRMADLRVSAPDGTVRGLIEVKVGNSPYTASQQLKDFFIKSMYGHPTNVVRYPTFP